MWTVQFCQNVSHRFVSDSLFTDQGPSESTSTIVIILFTWPLLQHTRHPLSKHRIDSEDRNINKNQPENNWKNTRKLSQKMVIKEIRGWFSGGKSLESDDWRAIWGQTETWFIGNVLESMSMTLTKIPIHRDTNLTLPFFINRQGFQGGTGTQNLWHKIYHVCCLTCMAWNKTEQRRSGLNTHTSL